MPLPLVHELTPPPDVFAALRALADWPRVALLESALLRDGVGRYSFLTARPIFTVNEQQPRFGEDPFEELRPALRCRHRERVSGLPPFQGGAVGLLAYESGRFWERLPGAVHDELRLPAVSIGVYDWVLAWDHAEDRAWIIAHGFAPLNRSQPRSQPRPPAAGRQPRPREEWAAGTIETVRAALAQSCGEAPAHEPGSPSGDGSGLKHGARPRLSLTAAQHPFEGPPRGVSNFDRDSYLRAVRRVVESIHAGDIFQANLSQRLMFPSEGDPLALYGRLRRVNPAPFAAFLAGSDWAVISASPERFLRVDESGVETRPIKGTRGRRPLPEADLFTRDELRESDKDQAENVMIVDLLRNDLSRVCRPGSIRVPQLCAVETYETVQHLVSQVQGELAEGRDFWDLLAAAFPGGSITGAPKVRAMEIITELEQVARGAYCGTLFYCGFDGTADSSILIRTFTDRGGWLQCPVGGGIVAQSDPAAEYEETLQKAAGMLRAL